MSKKFKRKILALLLANNQGGVLARNPLDTSTFYAPMNDLGNGEVNLVLTRGTGSATFTRASAAFTTLSDGTLKSVTSGVPRSNYSAAGVYLGYLAEGARTNRCLHSQDFSNAVWVSGGGGIAVATNSIAAPDGTLTADTLTASGANGTLIQDLGVVASAAKAGGLWLKRKTGTGNVDLTLNGGTGWTTQTINAVTWTRCELTATLADEDFGIRLVTSGDAVYAWQGQVETASFLSSDIVTTTVAVARAADRLSYQSTSNIATDTGACYAEFLQKDSTGNPAPAIVGDTGASPEILYLGGASPVVGVYDGSTATTTANTASTTSINKAASAWSSGKSVCLNGGTVATGTFDGTMAPIAIAIGSWNISAEPFASIKNARIWTSALTDAQLVTITT